MSPRFQYNKTRKRTKGIFSIINRLKVKPIWVRPKKVDLRIEPGHYEADLIVGRRANGYSNLFTLNEMCSRKLFIIKVPDKNPWKVASLAINLSEITI